MAEPRTEAGRALLHRRWDGDVFHRAEWVTGILAVEQEAIKDERKRLAGLVEGLRLTDNTGDPEDNGYMEAIEQVLALLSEGEPGA